MASILSTIQLETTSTSGTLTSEQLATLQESKTNYIVYGTELFKLVDNNTSGDTLIYTCSTNDSGTLKVKSITVTISTLAWTYSELSSGGGSAGTKKYQHNISLWTRSNITGTRTFKAYFSIITDSADEMTQTDVFDELVANNFTGIDGLSATGIIEDTSTNEFLIIDYIIADSTFQTIMLDGFSLLDNINKGYGFNYSDCRVNSDVVIEI